MLKIQPLKDNQNGNIKRKMVQKTYGKKGKTSALQSAKDIFTMTTDLESQFVRVSITDDKENINSSEIHAALDRTPAPAVKDEAAAVKSSTTEVTQLKISERADSHKVSETPHQDGTRVVRQTYISKASRSRSVRRDDSDSTSCDWRGCDLAEPTEDGSAISKFVQDHSDRDVLTFSSYGSTVAKKYNVKKIGEGTYSSVFSLTRKEYTSTSSANATDSRSDQLHRKTILKIMPILLPSQGDLEGMTEPFYITNELQTMKVMDPIHGFIRYRGLLVVKGPWPQSFLQAFRDFRTRSRKKAENEDPETAFGQDQYYALIEMEDAGFEMNDIKRPSDFQMYDMFWQTAIHLANAEQACGFEHRDLHVSNICVKPDDSANDRLDVSETSVSKMSTKPIHVLGMSNISVTIIDYTFSRVTLPDNLDPIKQTNFREFLIEGKKYDELLEDITKETKRPKNGEELENSMQHLTYAKVAKCVEHANELVKEAGTTHDVRTKHYVAPWEHHVPRTNVAWLGYLITCLLGRAGKMAKTKYVSSSNALAKSVQDDIRKGLLEVRALLMLEDVDDEAWPVSAADVVRLGVEKGWVTLAEIEKFKERLEQDS